MYKVYLRISYILKPLKTFEGNKRNIKIPGAYFIGGVSNVRNCCKCYSNSTDNLYGRPEYYYYPNF